MDNKTASISMAALSALVGVLVFNILSNTVLDVSSMKREHDLMYRELKKYKDYRYNRERVLEAKLLELASSCGQKLVDGSSTTKTTGTSTHSPSL